MSEETTKRWTIGEAKQQFSKVVRAASDEPQEILNRREPVAVVLAISAYEEYRQWLELQEGGSLAERTEELRRICREEAYELEVPARRDRLNPFAPEG